MRPRSLRTACALMALATAMPAAQRWQEQYFYDQAKSSLAIVDLAFGSPARGVAVGSIVEGVKRKPAVLVTADGGAHWEFVPFKQMPVSLFFLNENLGWMVTTKGIWETREAGKSWHKLPSAGHPVSRVYFVDEQHGWAACAKKTVLETEDGGQHWKPVQEASKQPGDARYSEYSWIVFPNAKEGIISGWNIPPRRVRQRFPGWMDPEATLYEHETPHLTLTLETHDGGKSWKSYSSSTFGVITRIRFDAQRGLGLGLIEYAESFQYPSEVYRIGDKAHSVSLYRDKKFAITDIWLAQDGTAYLAGAVYPGPLRAVPGKVQVLKSTDLKTWSPMDVDYRAVASRAVFGSAGGRLWLATDGGMILKLTD